MPQSQLLFTISLQVQILHPASCTLAPRPHSLLPPFHPLDIQTTHFFFKSPWHPPSPPPTILCTHPRSHLQSSRGQGPFVWIWSSNAWCWMGNIAFCYSCSVSCTLHTAHHWLSYCSRQYFLLPSSLLPSLSLSVLAFPSSWSSKIQVQYKQVQVKVQELKSLSHECASQAQASLNVSWGFLPQSVWAPTACDHVEFSTQQ